jgi:hypothetical protein
MTAAAIVSARRTFLIMPITKKRPADISVGSPVGTIDVLDILLDLPEPNDGAGDELRKQRDVRREFEEISRRRDHASVPIDDIGDRYSTTFRRRLPRRPS